MNDKNYIIAPSILSANFATRGVEVEDVMSSGAEWVHFDAKSGEPQGMVEELVSI